MKKHLKPRQREILEAFERLNCIATTLEVAKEAELDANGVSQTLNSDGFMGIVSVIGRFVGLNTKWSLRRDWRDVTSGHT